MLKLWLPRPRHNQPKTLNGQSFTNITRIDGITGSTNEELLMLDRHLSVTDL
jgi:hypothetical protein